jgi:hypothetical protein
MIKETIVKHNHEGYYGILTPDKKYVVFLNDMIVQGNRALEYNPAFYDVVNSPNDMVNKGGRKSRRRKLRNSKKRRSSRKKF